MKWTTRRYIQTMGPVPANGTYLELTTPRNLEWMTPVVAELPWDDYWAHVCREEMARPDLEAVLRRGK